MGIGFGGRVSGGSSRSRTSGGAGVSGGGVTRPHNCMSPGCTRRGEPERVKVSYQDVTRPHNCMSPGCTRRGEIETVNTRIEREIDRVKDSTAGKPFVQVATPRNYAPDPDPFRFTVVKSFCEGGFTLAKIIYHGCTNYEGQKILLFRKDIGSLVALDSLDPHFLETDENGLLARFIPTAAGWELGLAALKSLL